MDAKCMITIATWQHNDRCTETAVTVTFRISKQLENSLTLFNSGDCMRDLVASIHASAQLLCEERARVHMQSQSLAILIFANTK